MNKKGFTLVELLCVIVILAIITCIASAGVIKLSQSSKTNLYCAKIAMLKINAQTYGLKYEKELNNSTTLYDGYKSLQITVADLIESGILTPDQDNLVINPLDNTSMNDIPIILYLKNNRINVAISTNNVC